MSSETRIKTQSWIVQTKYRWFDHVRAPAYSSHPRSEGPEWCVTSVRLEA